MPTVNTTSKTAAWDLTIQSDLPIPEPALAPAQSLLTRWKDAFPGLTRYRIDARPAAGQWDMQWTAGDGRIWRSFWRFNGSGIWHADHVTSEFSALEFLPWQTETRAEWQRLLPLYAIKKVDCRWSQ